MRSRWPTERRAAPHLPTVPDYNKKGRRPQSDHKPPALTAKRLRRGRGGWEARKGGGGGGLPPPPPPIGPEVMEGKGPKKKFLA